MFLLNEFHYMMQRNEMVEIIKELLKIVKWKENTTAEQQQMLFNRIKKVKAMMKQLDKITADRSSKTRYKDESYYERSETHGKI